MSEKDPGSATVIGLGDMGGTLAGALLAHGYQVTVWNRSPDKAAVLAARGAWVASGVAEALAASPVCVACLLDHEVTTGVLAADGAASAVDGRTLIQVSTMTSRESADLGAWAARHGAAYLDAQVLDYPDDVRQGRATLVASGPKAVFDRHAPMLEAMVGRVQHVGERVGAAPTFDKAHLALQLGAYLAFLQGAAMCVRAGVDLDTWLAHNLHYAGGDQIGRELAILARQLRERAYDEGMAASIAVWRGAVAKIVSECATLGVDAAHLPAVEAAMDAALASGLGDKELGALFDGFVGGRDIAGARGGTA